MSDAPPASPSPPGGASPGDWSEFQRIAAEWGCDPAALPGSVKAKLRVRGVVDEVIVRLDGIGLSADAALNVGGVDLVPAAALTGEDTWLPRSPLEDGLLMIGAGPGGDPLCVDLTERVGATGWVSHGSLHDGARDHFAPLADSPAAFLAALSRDEDGSFPTDYFEARDVLRRTGGH